MPTSYVCAAGHRWAAQGTASRLCPECGQVAVNADNHAGTPAPSPPPAAGTAPAAAGRTAPPDVPTIPYVERFGPEGEHEPVPGYVLLGEIARGGMGIVYRARQISLNRVVALKMIRRLQDIEPHELRRFRIEAEAVARLNHPHIVRIHDFGEHNGRPYFSMELVEGGSLASRLAEGPLPVAEAARLIELLARAMDSAHRLQIIHRDLKPANVLLTEDGTPKIADFGLAKCLDDDLKLTVPYTIMGTASYMAPEQAGGLHQAIGPGVDVYALGAILFECLTGRPPFQAATRELTILQVLHEDPLRPSLVRPELPQDLEEICLKCLEKEAAHRYAATLDLAEDLRRFQAGEPLAIRPLDEWERQLRWARKAGYELLEVVGCTVLGLVYKARQLSLNRPVVLKTISTRARSDPRLLERFRHEAEVVAHMHHPNILQIYDFGEHQGQPYLSLEYVDGGTLADRWNELPLLPRQAAQLVRTLARATHVAHCRGVIHTDLRPFNVLLTGSGVPKITGFGLAWLLEKERQSSTTRTRRVLSNYMAPEQAAATPGPLTPATDVHALGAMLYEMLTGQSPFMAETIHGTLEQVLHAEPVPPGQLQPGLPPRLEAICLRCLRKEPAERYESAEELAEELRRFQGEQTETGEFELIPGYELLEELGRGGTGVVYKARQVSLDRLVALKVFRADVARVLTANRAVARLSHPNLVPVFDCGEREGLLYVVEELVDGNTLEQRIAGRPQPPVEAARLVLVLAEAMQAVHQHGIIHCNLKPSVVHLSRQGVPRINSFDLAYLPEQDHEGAEKEGPLAGTPTYMAPEQAGGEVALLGPATDVYALGGILYQMLAGRPAFVHDSLMELLVQVRSRPPLPPRFFQPQVPAELEVICLKCLHKEPARRFATAAELAQVLSWFLRQV